MEGIVERSTSNRAAVASRTFVLTVLVGVAVIVACRPVETQTRPSYRDAYVSFQYPEGWSVSAAGAEPKGFWRIVVGNPRSRVEKIEVRYKAFAPDATGIWTIGDGISHDQMRLAAKTFGSEYLSGYDQDFEQRTVPAGFSQTVTRSTQYGRPIALQGTTVWAGGQFAHIAHLREQSASSQPHGLVVQSLAFATFSLVGNWSTQGRSVILRADGTFERLLIRDRGIFVSDDEGRYRIDDKTVTLQTPEGQTICSLTFRDGRLTGCNASYQRD
jgi:hypothetical protein